MPLYMLRIFYYFSLLIATLLFNVAQASVGEEQLQNRAEGMQYFYAGAHLEEQWHKLHTADAIAYPNAADLQQLLKPYIGTTIERGALPDDFDHDYSALALQVQQAWRLFHAGQYRDAYDLANTLGLAGLLPKLRSLAINHHYFVDSRQERQATFAALIREIERTQMKYSLESASIYLLKAFAIGRYGQEISPLSAFAKGLGGKLKRNIYKAAELEPHNTEAIMFKAVFDAEAINHAGSITGKLLYGASKKRARSYFEQAIAASPDSTALLLEYGKACLYICRRKERNKAYQALHQLSQAPALDLGDLENKKQGQKIINKQLANKKPKASTQPSPKLGQSA